MSLGAYFKELNDFIDALPCIDPNKAGTLHDEIEKLKLAESSHTRNSFISQCTAIRRRVHSLLNEIDAHLPYTAEERIAASKKNFPNRRARNGRGRGGGARFRS